MYGKYVLRRLLFSVSILAISCAAISARADVSLRWQTGDASPLSPLLASYLADSNVVADFVKLVDENFRFAQPLVIELGASSGPDYVPERNTIRMPYTYLERAVLSQSHLTDSSKRANAVDRAVSVVEYTLYHLLGHSLVSSADKIADDTVEALSTYIMVAYWPNGAEQWAEDVEAFAAASQKLDNSLADYWHTHALYGERERVIQCWIEGSIPGRLALLQSINPEMAETYKRCQASWNNLEKTSVRLLEPFLLPDSTLGRALRLR